MSVDLTIRSKMFAAEDTLARIAKMIDGEKPQYGWQCIEFPKLYLVEESGMVGSGQRFVACSPKIWLSPEDPAFGIGPNDFDAIMDRSAFEVAGLFRGLQTAAHELSTHWRVALYEDWVGFLGPDGPDSALAAWVKGIKNRVWDPRYIPSPFVPVKDTWEPWSPGGP